MLLQRAGDEVLLDLARRIARRREVEILRQLLRDRRAAGGELLPLPVALERFLHRLDVDAMMLEERVVFGHEHGPPQRRRDAGVRDPLPAQLVALALRAQLL